MFVYDYPSDSIYAKFRLFHELGHVGWAGVSWARRYFELVEVALILIFARLSWHSTRALWIVLIWASLRLLFRLSGYTALKYEFNADLHAIRMIYASGCSAEEMSKLPFYLLRCGNRFRSHLLARACSACSAFDTTKPVGDIPVYEWWMGLLFLIANTYAISGGFHVSSWCVVIGLFTLVVVVAMGYLGMGFMLGCVDWLAVEIRRGGWRKYEELRSEDMVG